MPDDLTRRSHALDKKLSESPVQKQIASLARTGRINRRLITVVVVLALVNGGLGYRLSQEQSRERALVARVEVNSVSIIQECERANDTARRELTLWRGILALIGTNPDPKDAPLLGRFNQLVTDAFPISVCLKSDNP